MHIVPFVWLLQCSNMTKLNVQVPTLLSNEEECLKKLGIAPLCKTLF